MSSHRTFSRVVCFIALGALLLALAGCSLAGEPERAAPLESISQDAQPTVPALSPDEVQSALPVALPRAANGAAIFAENCAACHGPQGNGGGEMTAVLTERGVALPDFSDPEFARTRSPQDWHAIITLGTLDQGGFMPPVTLSDEERWDVTYFLYSLSTPPDQVQRGRELFATSCSACHGPDGSGMGLTDPATLADSTQAEIAALLSGGEDEDHDFAGWPQADIEVVTAYTWTLGYEADLSEVAEAPIWEVTPTAEPTGEAASGADEAPDATSEPVTSMQIEGEVTTVAGEPLPAGTEVTVQGITLNDEGGFDFFAEHKTMTVEGGGFSFTGVDLPEDPNTSMYKVSVTYQGAEFTNAAMVDLREPVMDLPITVFEVSADAGIVTADVVEIMFLQHPDALIVVQRYLFSNLSASAVYLGEEQVGEQRASVSIPVPEDAHDFQFGPMEGGLGGRYQLQGSRIYDTRPVFPGAHSHQINLAYVLPFDGSRDLEIPLDYGAQQVTVWVNGEGQVRSGDLTSIGVQYDAEGASYNTFSGGGLVPGDTLTLTVSSSSAGFDLRQVALPGLIAIGALLVIGGGAYWYFNHMRGGVRDEEDEPGEEDLDSFTPDQEALLKQIADLDDAYDEGKINRLDYEARRAALKAKLAESLRE